MAEAKRRKKNSNYVTEKTIRAAEEKARRIKQEKIKRIVISSVCIFLILALIVGGIVAIGVTNGWWVKDYHAAIEIEGYGTIHLELYGDVAPRTVSNFVRLAKRGFYDGLTFHRIIDGFMIQGGDPDANGTGGSKREIKGEFSENGFENNLKHERGVISMARGNDPDSASSQFFIVQTTYPSLDGKYAAFGKVTSGMEFVDMICADANPTDDNGTIRLEDQPVITRITIHEAHEH